MKFQSTLSVYGSSSPCVFAIVRTIILRNSVAHHVVAPCLWPVVGKRRNNFTQNENTHISSNKRSSLLSPNHRKGSLLFHTVDRLQQASRFLCEQMAVS